MRVTWEKLDGEKNGVEIIQIKYSCMTFSKIKMNIKTILHSEKKPINKLL